ncbi:MAG: methyltransferase domain-containing protein [Sulfolobales archaeon]
MDETSDESLLQRVKLLLEREKHEIKYKQKSDERIFIYDLIADKYEDLVISRSFFYSNHYREIIRFLRKQVLKRVKRGGLVADIGCGTGFWSLLLKKLGYQVIGIDISSRSIEISFSRGVESLAGDARHMSFRREAFDLVLSLASVLNHLKNPREFFRDASYILKPGGFLVFDFDSSWALDNLYEALIYKNYSKKILKSLITLKILREDLDLEWSFGGIEIKMFSPIEIMRILKEYGLDIIRVEPIHIFPGFIPVRIQENTENITLKKILTALYKIDHLVKKVLPMPIPLPVSYIVLARKKETQ